MTTTNERWLVTGASSGIGRSAALLLAAEGAALLLAGRDPERTGAVVQEALDAGAPSAEAILGDLGDAAFTDELVGRAAPVTGVVHAAGFSTSRPLHELRGEEVIDQIAVNALAVTALNHALVPDMIAAGRGHVLVVGSLSAWQGVPTQTVYAATKAYVTNLTLALHGELRGTGVNVTALCPGLVRTAFFERAGIDLKRRFARIAPWDDPDDVARAGLRGVRRNELLVIPGFRNRLSPFLQRFLPRSFIASMTRRMMEPVA